MAGSRSLKVSVDQARCQGHARCHALAPELFALDELGNAHVVGDAERVASEKFSQRIGQNITQLESDSQLESISSVKTA